jgi:hypothetical protein
MPSLVFGLFFDEPEQRMVIENYCAPNRTCGKLLPTRVEDPRLGMLALCATDTCPRIAHQGRTEWAPLDDGRRLHLRRLTEYKA